MTTTPGPPVSRFGKFGSLALAALPLLPTGKVAAQDVPAPAATSARRDFAIPSGNLAAALDAFTRQTGLRVALGDARIAELQTRGARGSLTTTEALAQLLGGTGYVASRDGEAFVLTPTGSTGAAYEVTVTGFRAKEQGSATKTALSIRDTPQAISVTTRESMEIRQVRDLTSALELTAGLTSGIAADGGPFAGRGLGGGEGFLMRGQELQGRRDVRMDGFVVASRTFDMVAFERIEVVKGPSSVLYGQGSLGGFINMIRRKPQAQFAGSVVAQAASWDSYRAEFDLTGALDDNERYRGRVTAAYDDSGSFTDDVDTRTVTVAPSLAAEFGDMTVLAQVLYQEDEYTPSRGMPLRRDGDELFIPDIERELFTGVPSQEESSGRVYLATLEIDKPLNDNWLMALLLQKSGVKSERFFDAYSNACCLDTSGFVYMYSDTSRSHGDSWAGELRLDGRFDALGREHRVLVGLEHAQRDDDLAFGYTYLGPGNLYTREFQAENVIPGGARFQNFDFDFTNENLDQGVYGQLLLTMTDRWKLLVGARYDWSEIEHLNNNDGQLDTKDDGEMTWRLGVTWEPTANLIAYGVYAQTFNPTVDARSDSGAILEPETGEGLEFGLKSEWFDGRLGANLAVFRQELDNIPISAPPPNDNFSINGGLQRTDGIEIEVSGEVDGLTVGLAATWLDSEYIDPRDPNYGLAPWGLIDNQSSLFINYEVQSGPLQGLGFGGTVIDVGKRWQSDYFLAGYTRADLNLSYRLAQWDVSLQLRNVTDERYVERLRDLYQDNFFGAPRAVVMRAEYRF
jgi:iron complex outermembrane receptor protein